MFFYSMNLGSDKRMQRKASINRAICKRCLRCIQVCPQQAIKVKDGYPVVDREKCIGCGICLNNCPLRAISFAPPESEILSEIRQRLKEITERISYLQKRLDLIKNRR